jgi:hypothetical protein
MPAPRIRGRGPAGGWRRGRDRRRRDPAWRTGRRARRGRALAITSPQGATTVERPQVRRPSSCVPPWAGARMKAPVSMARARSRVSQWASPVGTVKAAGTAIMAAPGPGQRPVQLREADIVADGQAQPAPGRAGHHGGLAGPDRLALAPALARRQIDIEDVQLVIGGDDLAAVVDQQGPVGGAVVVRDPGFDDRRADQHPDAQLAGQIAQARHDRVIVLERQHRSRAGRDPGSGNWSPPASGSVSPRLPPPRGSSGATWARAASGAAGVRVWIRAIGSGAIRPRAMGPGRPCGQGRGARRSRRCAFRR